MKAIPVKTGIMPTSEGDIQRLIMIELSAAGHTVFRANVGLFYTKDGRPVTTGLPVGFSDLFGHRGEDIRAFYFEVKDLDSKKIRVKSRNAALLELAGMKYPTDWLPLADGWMRVGATFDQAKFLLAMKKRGAIAGVVRSVDDALNLLAL